ncbi:MAG: DUF3878 family protein [Schaedlerella sp.]|nr:DUF3878 family protein [Schaedlerella sp.]
MKKITAEQLFKYIEEILAHNAFEVQMKNSPDGALDFYVPYIMNDALECYLIIHNVYLQGEYLNYFYDDTTVELLGSKQRPALVFHQGTSNVFTVWFEECYQVSSCYRYDQTGHFWREGAEHLRRLVYILGTIHDKHKYMGDEVCNEEEKELLQLMGFAPLRMYSPLKESIDSHYPDTPEGYRLMEQYAEEVEDKFYVSLLKLYNKFHLPFLKTTLFQSLNFGRRHKLYYYIYQKMVKASMTYPEREYSKELTEYIQTSRKQVEEILKDYGFEGNYPFFHRDNMQIFAVEEHPFTILEADDYSFRIQFMVSETDADEHPLHYGFFEQKGNHGRIEETLDFLKG